jgi:hypothetical protein
MPACCASHTKDFLEEVSNLAIILSQFSSFSTCLLPVLLLPKMEPVDQNLFTYKLFSCVELAKMEKTEFTVTLPAVTVFRTHISQESTEWLQRSHRNIITSA